MDPSAHGYLDSPRRLLVVGQETFGWGEDFKPDLDASAGVERCLDRYRRFEVGAQYLRSPFWVAARWFQEALNPAAPPSAFLWTNLCKVDEGQRRPPADVQSLLLERFDLLAEELRLTSPEVVLFLTGPCYDDMLRAQLPGVEFVPVGGHPARTLSRLRHRDLPERSFRTYHPGYLRRARKWGVLEDIGALAG
jgi:hypothetical protein